MQPLLELVSSSDTTLGERLENCFVDRDAVSDVDRCDGVLSGLDRSVPIASAAEVSAGGDHN